MSTTKLIAVFAENQPGQTARVTRILADAGVNIRCVTIASNGTFGVMKFLVDKCEEGVRCLREKGLMVSLVEVLAVEVENKPGALQRVAETLGSSFINLDNCSGFVANDRAILVNEVHDVTAACEALVARGHRVLTGEEMLRL